MAQCAKAARHGCSVGNSKRARNRKRSPDLAPGLGLPADCKRAREEPAPAVRRFSLKLIRQPLRWYFQGSRHRPPHRGTRAGDTKVIWWRGKMVPMGLGVQAAPTMGVRASSRVEATRLSPACADESSAAPCAARLRTHQLPWDNCRVVSGVPHAVHRIHLSRRYFRSLLSSPPWPD